MQSSSDWNDTIIRAIDFSGEKEFKGAIELICCLIVAREAGWKILASVNLVIKRVLEGGAGDVSPGKDVRSIDRGDLDLFLDIAPGEVVADTGGETCKPIVWSGGSCVATDIVSVVDCVFVESVVWS